MTILNGIQMLLEDLQRICKTLPAATEDIKWGHDLVFSIGEKMFCALELEQFPTSASFKVKEEEFDEMCSRSGFKPAPYAARYKWVQIDDIRKLNIKDWRFYICQSYGLVKEKLSLKVKKELGIL